jgi:hypothetical protein
MRNSNEFYDVKISQDIISEKEINIITNNLMKDENVSYGKHSDSKHSDSKQSDSKQSDSKHWYDNKCFFLSALILTSTVLASGLYMCFIFT